MVGRVVAKIWLGQMPRKLRQPYFTRRGLEARRDILLYSQYQGVVAGVDAEISLVLYISPCEEISNSILRYHMSPERYNGF